MQSLIRQSRPTGRNQSNQPRRARASPIQVAQRVQRYQTADIKKGLTRAMSKTTLQSGSGAPIGAAVAYSSTQRTRPAQVTADSNSCRVIHRELIANVVGSTAFAVPLQFALNPGLAATFPWLSTIAQQWEQYRFNKLRFCYYTRAATSTPGSVQLVTDYDAADPPPLTEMAASSYQDTVEDVPWKELTAILKPSSLHPMGPKKYTRVGPLASNLDIKTYDGGNFFVTTTDGTTASWGKLWVEYDVTLSVPQVSQPGSSFLHITSSTPDTNHIAPSPTVVSGTLAASVAGNVITLPIAGAYLITLNETASTSVTFASISTTGVLDTSFNSVGYTLSGSTSTDFTENILVVTSLPSQTVTFANTLVGGSGSILTITLLPAGSV